MIRELARDLVRFAIVTTNEREVLDVGLNRTEAEAFLASYNGVMGEEAAQVVAITWALQGN
jgi:hypothetical protein